jgi:diguanylate cyclase (GGDEF)-like protein
VTDQEKVTSWRRWRLLVKMVLIAGVPVVALGLVLGNQLRSSVTERAVADGLRTAELVSRLGIQPMLSPADVDTGMDPARYQRLDRSIRDSGLLGNEVARIKIWNTRGQVVFSDDRKLVGQTFEVSDELADALGGRIASELSHLGSAEQASERSYGKVIEVYVPLRFAADRPPGGAFELYLPYRPIETKIDSELRQMNLILAGGLAVLAVVLGMVALTTERLRRQSEISAHQATHDVLTGLPNRVVFYDRLHQAILAAQRSGKAVCTMGVDLDKFKAINDTLGHQAGDAVLAEIAARLRQHIRGGDTVARLGGDEFSLLLPATAADEAVAMAHRILAGLAEPFVIQGETLRLGASIGISQYPHHAADADALIARADFAMYLAKRSGGGVSVHDGEATPAATPAGTTDRYPTAKHRALQPH